MSRVSLVALPLLCAALSVPEALVAQAEPEGKQVYDRWCASCHGDTGAGDGVAAAYMLPRPRDFTRGTYQVRSTPSGQLPTDADLRRIIDDGMPGTAMPGWRRTLSESERDAVSAYIKTFSAFFAQGPAPEPLSTGRAPRASDEDIEEGRQFYQSIECWKCHGNAGRGDGSSAPTQEDDSGFPIRPADLTAPWRFNGGGTVADIFRTMLTGLDGTPMPSFHDLIESGFLTQEQLWNVAHYVRSLAPERDPTVREVVRARRVEALPAAVDDAAWDDVDRYYIPLVGQIIARGRWFAPSVHSVWVQALHDGTELALRLSWTDPSQSPAPEWAAWRSAVLAAMEPRDVAPPEGALPDALTVQFPRVMPRGMERPYFLFGNANEPVYVWRWQSAPSAIGEFTARGIDRLDPIAGPIVQGSATFGDGQWQLLLRRALATAEGDAERLAFPTAQTIPFTLAAWDGDNGEAGTRAAIGTWYFIYLDEAAPRFLYAAPLVATLLTAGLGLFLVRRAQRRAHSASPATSDAAAFQPVPAGAAGDGTD